MTIENLYRGLSEAFLRPKAKRAKIQNQMILIKETTLHKVYLKQNLNIEHHDVVVTSNLRKNLV